MIELDYAFLADYAAVQDSKLTVVGASFTQLRVPELPVQFMLHIAGRVRCSPDISEAPLHLTITPPDESYRIEADVSLGVPPDSVPYGSPPGTVGLLFAVGAPMPLPVSGLYEVTIDIEGVRVRTLRFEAIEGQ